MDVYKGGRRKVGSREGLRKPKAGDLNQAGVYGRSWCPGRGWGTLGGALSYFRREQTPILTVTDPHGSIVIGHGD